MPPAIIAGAVSAVGSIGGAIIGGNAAKSAAATQAAANDRAIAAQQAQQAQTRGDLMPYNQAGQKASDLQADLLGLSGATRQQAAITALQGQPLYQSLKRTGTEALLQNASATGGLRGGNTQGALAQFEPNLLAGVIQNQLQNLGGVASLGENAAAMTGNAGSNSANNISALLAGTGAAQAGAQATAGGYAAGAANNIAQTIAGLIGRSGTSAMGSAPASVIQSYNTPISIPSMPASFVDTPKVF